MEQETGLEPAMSPWKGEVLPLHYSCKKMAGMVGFEPTGAANANGFRGCHLKPLGHIPIGANSEIRTHGRLVT